MKNTFKSILFTLAFALLVAISANAQPNFSVISHVAPDYGEVDGEEGQHIIGSKSFLRLTNPSPGNFEPSASGSCGYPYPTGAGCNNLRILFLGDSSFASMISVSATSLVFISPNIASNGDGYTIAVQKQTSPGVWSATHVRNVTVRRNKPLPIGSMIGGYLYPTGNLYKVEASCGGVTILNSISAANNDPFENGYSTFVQVYYTGIHSDDWDNPDFKIDGNSNIAFGGVYSEGVYAINISSNRSTNVCNSATSWSSGENYVLVKHENDTDAFEGLYFRLNFN